MLNASKPNKYEAYKKLLQAAEFKNVQAKIMVAWAKLLGSTLSQDIEAAKQTFIELAEIGNPDAHMVRKIILNIYSLPSD